VTLLAEQNQLKGLDCKKVQFLAGRRQAEMLVCKTAYVAELVEKQLLLAEFEQE
jgi:hypothetical protein